MYKKGLKEQFRLLNNWLIKRLDSVLPTLMAEYDIDMWIVLGSENNEDPVLKTMLPKEFFGALGKNILVFTKNDKGSIDQLTISRPLSAIDDYYTPVWFKQKGKNWAKFYKWKETQGLKVAVNLDDYQEETEWECLNRIVGEYKPNSIGLNYSDITKFADGISYTEYNQIKDALNKEDQGKIVSADGLAVAWLESRIDEEIAYYQELTDVAESIIKRAYSPEVIQVGKTTCDEVRWFMMQEAVNLGCAPWFEATIWINRQGATGLDDHTIIEHGDLLHCDFGVEYMGLCTDMQEMCYVMREEDDCVPIGIQKAHEQANRLRDILGEEIKVGLSGNDVFLATMERAKNEGLKPAVYTHPIGYHGHAAGSIIGLFTAQEATPRGERLLRGNTMFSFEMNVTACIEEWNNQDVMYGLETDVLLREDSTVHYFTKSQTLPNILAYMKG